MRFFRLFLCAFKEIGSGASPRLSEAPHLESRTKLTRAAQRMCGLNAPFVKTVVYFLNNQINNETTRLTMTDVVNGK
ncbi:MAG: hypothetical protein P8014_05755 [Acidihalobacter sp.]|uniref:hypothetical protein n=1 Tax=Acidihalobacter sp. TaxID=1872108 RepID=UPI00307D7AA8